MVEWASDSVGSYDTYQKEYTNYGSIKENLLRKVAHGEGRDGKMIKVLNINYIFSLCSSLFSIL